MSDIDVSFKPFHDRVLVRPAKLSEEVSQGGLVLPEAVAAGKKSRGGEVIAVGPGLLTPDGERVPLMAEVGTTVFYGKFSGDSIVLDGEEYRILRDSDIYGAALGGAQ